MNNFKFDYYQYKQRINPKKKINIFIYLVVIILLLGLALIIKPYNSVKFYFVEVGCFNKFSDASALATQLKQQNAAGYVYFNGQYHVLACAYLNMEDAENVLNNIKEDYPKAKTLVLSTFEFKESSLYKTEKDAIKKVVDANNELIENMYNLTIEFDKNLISEQQLKLKLQSLQDSYKKDVENFKTVFKTNNKVSTLKENIVSIENAIAKPTFSSELKYNLIKISICHYSFLEFFC